MGIVLQLQPIPNEIKRLFSGDVQFDRDRIVVSGSPPNGCLVWRPGGIVHELNCGHGLSRRRIADSLIDFAIDDATSREFKLYEAIFITDSDEFRQYIENRYGNALVHEDGKRVYTLRIRP